MNKNAFRDYLINMGRFPLLTAEQEIELGRRILEEGDMAARETLINSNLRLVVYVAKKYKNAHLPIEDLVSEGSLGLVNAVDKYDYRLGYRFSTCAIPWIKQAILKAITEKGKTIRLPAHIYSQLKKMKDAMDTLAMKSNVTPSDAEIAAVMGIEPEKVNALKQWRKDTISLNESIGDEEKTTLEDLVEDDSTESPAEYTEKSLMHEYLQNAISQFPERTQIIIKMRFGLGAEGDPTEFFQEHTLEEIGAYLGLTRERVRQIEKQTIQEMKIRWGQNR